MREKQISLMSEFYPMTSTFISLRFAFVRCILSILPNEIFTSPKVYYTLALLSLLRHSDPIASSSLEEIMSYLFMRLILRSCEKMFDFETTI